MNAFRISIASVASLFWVSAAMAQDDMAGHATAPPRQLGGSHPPSEDPADVMDSGTLDEGGPVESDGTPTRQEEEDVPPDVSTEDLLDDVPADERSRPERAAPASPGPKEAAPATVLPDVPARPKPPVIQVGTLGKIDGAPAGVLDSTGGGFEPNMWNGSSREQVETLLSKAPVANADGAVRALARRLILTKADAPQGAVRRALITIRIEKLLDAGMIDDAGALAAVAQLKDDPDFARVQANALLYAARNKDICGDATISRLNEDELFWLQLRSYCAAAAGDSSTADLVRAVLDAQGKSDTAYNTLVDDVISGAKRAPGKIAKPTAIHAFLLRKAGLPIGNDVAAKLGTPGSVLAMRDTRNSPEARLAAAERALKAGAASIAELKAIAEAQNIPASRTATALEAAPKLSFLNAQVLLRRAAQMETRPAVKAALLHEALTLGDKAGMFEIASGLQADVALTVDPAAVPADQRPLIGWSLLLAGKPDTAARWIGKAEAPHAVLALVMNKDDVAQADLSSLAHDLSADPKPANINEAFEALVLGLYDALGKTLPADAKSAADTASAKHWPGRRPDPDAMQKLMQSVAAPDRKGEAILRILDIVGPKGLGDLAPDVTIELVRALEGMGIKDAARAFAIHALLLYRPGSP
jgi:hypothetical protein